MAFVPFNYFMCFDRERNLHHFDAFVKSLLSRTFSSKGDQKDGSRVPISSKLVADLLKRAGASYIMMLDPHTPQLEGFFDTPVDALKVSKHSFLSIC